MLGFIDRPLLVALSGLVLSYLESSGVVSPTFHDTNLQIVQAIVGGVLAIVSVASYFIHHTAVTNQKLALGVSTPPTDNSFIQTLLNGLKSFIFSNSPKNTVQPELSIPLPQS